MPFTVSSSPFVPWSLRRLLRQRNNKRSHVRAHSLGFFALSVCVVIELIVAYCTYDKLWTSTGGIDRNQLYFGWGIYNTIGMLFTVSMPSAAYLARRYRRGGHFFTVYLVVLLVCAFLSMSRQAMLCGSLVFLICAAWILIKCPERWLNAAIFVGSALVAVIVRSKARMVWRSCVHAV